MISMQQSLPKPLYVQALDVAQQYFSTSSISRYLLYLLASVIPVLVGWLSSLCFHLNFNNFLELWVKYNFSGWVFGSFLFMNYAYQRSLESFDDLLLMAKTSYNKHLIWIQFKRMYRSKQQTVVCAVTGLLTAITGTFLGVNIAGFYKYYIIINSFIAGFVVGYGLWHTIALSRLFRILGRLDNISINIKNPFSSVGLLEIPLLASNWSVVFFAEIIIVYVGLVLPEWSRSNVAITAVQSFWLTVFLLIGFYNYFYPRHVVHKMVNEQKRDVLIHLQDKLDNAYTMDAYNKEEIENMQAIIDFTENRIDQVISSSGHLVDIRVVVRFAITTLLAIALLVIENIDTLARVWRFIQNEY